MSDQMYALVKQSAAPGLDLVRVEKPVPGPLDVLIHIRKTSICGTDVHIYNWDRWSREHVTPPVTIGHEYCGEVAAVGELVTQVKPGDLVSGEGHIVCGTCRNCRAGQRHLCNAPKGVGVERPGAFAEYLCIPEANVVRLRPGIPEEIAAIFDPFGNAVHTALKFRLVGEDVLVSGAGPIGMMAARVARFCGARHIVVTDIKPYRLELVKTLEPSIHTINVEEISIRDEMHQLGMTEGFDVAMEMSGAESAVNATIAAMKNGGEIALLGTHGREATVDWNQVIYKSLTVKGVYGREMFETWYKMMAMVEAGLDLTSIITHRFDFRDYEEGFAVMNSGNSGKVILDWTHI